MFNRIRQWEPWLIPFIPQSGGIAVDVGAAQGTWTMDLSERFKTVVSVEPHPENFLALRKATAKAHPSSCIITHHAAISTHTGTKVIHLFEKPDHTSFFKEGDGIEAWRSKDLNEVFHVRTYSLDDLILGSEWGEDQVTFVKVDTEGAEGLVLRGGQKVMESHHPVWLIEYHSDAALDECKQILSHNKYSAFQHIEHPNKLVKGHGWLYAP